jgi:hypothetical protein
MKVFYFVGAEQVGQSEHDLPPPLGTVVEVEQSRKYYRIAAVVLVVGNGSFYKVILTDKPAASLGPKSEPQAQLGVYQPLSQQERQEQTVRL